MEKTEFWEEAFKDKQEMWGLQPSNSAVLAKDFFIENSIKNILIPGFGYGRNAQIFKENGMKITGIEISKTAIDLAKKHYNNDYTIYNGSVTDMPFDKFLYDGIFCYGLIHLLDSSARQKLIFDCYNQLSYGGYMIFTAITKTSPTYGKGKFISKDRYEIYEGAKIYFYDTESIQVEFGNVGLLEVFEVNENLPLYFVKCKKDKR